MKNVTASGRINVKALILLCLALAAAGGGAVGFHYYRKRTTANEALIKGRAAQAAKNWELAASNLKTYLAKYPDDVAVLREYVNVNRLVRPKSKETIGPIIGAYRRLLRHHPGEAEACHRLARIYYIGGDFEEVLYVCGQRLAAEPADVEALLWRGRALFALGRRQDARTVLEQIVQRHDPANLQAYLTLSNLALQDRRDDSLKSVLQILDTAIAKCKQPAEALVQRSRFHRLVASDYTREGKSDAAQAELTAARKDLEAADELKSRDPMVRLSLCEEWVNHAEFDKARKELAALSDLDEKILDERELLPSDLELPRRLAEAEILLRIGDKEKALAHARDSMEKLPKVGQELFMAEAVRLYLLGQDMAAARKCVEDLRAVVRTKWQNDAARNEELTLLDASVKSAEGKSYEAVQMLMPLVSGTTRNTQALWALWTIYRDLGQDRRGVKYLEEYASRMPGDYAACIALSRAFAGYDWDKAFRYARMAEQINSLSLEARLLRAQSALMPALKQDPASPFVTEMVKFLRTLQAEHPKVAAIRNLLSTAANAAGRTEEAERVLRESIAQCDSPQSSQLLLIDLLARRGRTDEAMALCREAGAQAGDSAKPWVRLAELASSSGKAAEAKADLEKAAKALSGDVALTVERARAELLLSNKERDAGLALLRALCTAHPKDIGVRLSLILQPELQSDAKAAQQLVNEIKAIQGDAAVEWQCEQVGIWLRADQWRNRQAEIIAMLGRCIEADATWQQPVLFLGAMYDQLGDPEKAIEVYQTSLAASSGNVDVANRLLELLERQQRFSEAHDVLSRLPSGGTSQHTLNVALGREDYSTAISELQARVARDPRDAMSRAMLAGLVYSHRADDVVKDALRRLDPPVTDAVAYALKLLDDAAKVSPDLLAIPSVRMTLLRSEGRPDDALSLANDIIKRQPGFAPLLLRAQHYAATGQLEKAEKDFDVMVALPDAPADAYIASVQFLRACNKMDKAVGLLNAAIQKYPDHDGIKGQLTRMLLARDDERDRSRGRAMLDELLSRNPNNPDLLIIKATVLLGQRTEIATKEGLDLLERVVRLRPRAVSAHLELIRHALQNLDHQKARQLLDRALASNPDDPALLLRRAQSEVEAGRSAVARQLLGSIISMPTGKMDAATRVDAYLMAAKLDHVSGKTDDAIGDLEMISANEASRKFPGIWLMLSDLYRFKGDVETAEKRLETARQLDPEGEGVLVGHMNMLAVRKDFAGLARWLKERRSTHPGDARILLGGASILTTAESSEHLQSAREIVEALLATQPGLADAYLILAHICYAQKDMKSTQAAYERLLKIDPDNWEALNDMAWITCEEGGNAMAGLALANRGLEKHPGNVHLLDTRGVILTKLGKLAEAERDLQQCIVLAKDTPRTQAGALLHLARVQLQKGAKSDCARSVREAKSLDARQRVLSPSERAELDDLARQSR